MHSYFRRTSLVLFFALSSLPVSAGTRRAPKVSFRDLGGAQQTLAAHQGHIVVLNFWATWCAPCQEEIPRLTALASSYSGKGVDFLFVSIDEPKDLDKVRRFATAHPGAQPILTGASAETIERFGLKNIVPATLIVAADGEIVTGINGEARDEDVRTSVDWLLEGRRGVAPPSQIKRY